MLNLTAPPEQVRFWRALGVFAVCCMGASKRLGGVSVLRAMLRVHWAEAGGIKTAASGN